MELSKERAVSPVGKRSGKAFWKRWLTPELGFEWEAGLCWAKKMGESVLSPWTCFGYIATSVPGRVEGWQGKGSKRTGQGQASTGEGAVNGERPATKLGVQVPMEAKGHGSERTCSSGQAEVTLGGGQAGVRESPLGATSLPDHNLFRFTGRGLSWLGEGGPTGEMLSLQRHWRLASLRARVWGGGCIGRDSPGRLVKEKTGHCVY